VTSDKLSQANETDFSKINKDIQKFEDDYKQKMEKFNKVLEHTDKVLKKTDRVTKSAVDAVRKVDQKSTSPKNQSAVEGGRITIRPMSRKDGN